MPGSERLPLAFCGLHSNPNHPGSPGLPERGSMKQAHRQMITLRTTQEDHIQTLLVPSMRCTSRYQAVLRPLVSSQGGPMADGEVCLAWSRHDLHHAAQLSIQLQAASTQATLKTGALVFTAGRIPLQETASLAISERAFGVAETRRSCAAPMLQVAVPA